MGYHSMTSRTSPLTDVLAVEYIQSLSSTVSLIWTCALSPHRLGLLILFNAPPSTAQFTLFHLPPDIRAMYRNISRTKKKTRNVTCHVTSFQSIAFYFQYFIFLPILTFFLHSSYHFPRLCPLLCPRLCPHLCYNIKEYHLTFRPLT